jgi:hypothetical protein
MINGGNSRFIRNCARQGTDERRVTKILQIFSAKPTSINTEISAIFYVALCCYSFFAKFNLSIELTL